MKLVFVDAENIGFKQVEEIKARLADRVFVFSKDSKIQEFCEKKSFLTMSSYPSGSNQADFYIIGKLVAIAASLSSEQTHKSEFVLYFRDNSLVSAFSFQCKLHNVKSKIALDPKSNQTITGKQPLEESLLEVLSEPATAEEAREKLKANKSDFTRAINRLIAGNKIQRSSESKKWERTVYFGS